MAIVPLLVGVRFNSKQVYVEPAVGFGIMNSWWMDSQGRLVSLSSAIIGGMMYKNFDFCRGYQRTGNFGQVMIKIGYDFHLGQSSK